MSSNVQNTTQQQYVCPICKNKFNSKDQLRNHIEKAHPKNIPCPDCNKKFRTNQDLSKHKSTAHKAGRKCPHCNRILKTEKALNQHIKDKHKEIKDKNKPFNCSYCNKPMKDETALKQHVKLKHQKKFNCPDCNRKFKTELSLQQHIDNKHNQGTLPKPVARIKPLQVFEHIPFLEQIATLFRRLFKHKKKVVMDECVGNDLSVINELKDRFDVIPLPKELISHKDRELRLAISEKKWGLVSKDSEMTFLAKSRGIKIVYYLKESKGNRVLIRLSKRNKKEIQIE